MAKHHNEQNGQSTGEIGQPIGTMYQFQKGRLKRITSHLGTLKIKSGSDTITFAPEQLKGEAYIDVDYTGAPIKGQNGMGWRFAISKILPYPQHEVVDKRITFGNVKTKEDWLEACANLYDDTEAYNQADMVMSANGQNTGPKAFTNLCDRQGLSVAQQLVEDLAYGVGLRYQNNLMRKIMVAKAEEDLRNENGLAAPATKTRAAKQIEGDDSDAQV